MSAPNKYAVLAVCLAMTLATLYTLQCAANAAAQDESAPPPGAAPPKRHGRQPGLERFNAFAQRLRTRADQGEEDLTELMELVRAWRMMKEVGLSEEEALNMLKLGREMKRQIGQLGEQRKRVMLGLTKLLDNPDAKDESIKKELQKLDRIDERQRRIAREYERKMEAGLTVRQQAKLRLFKTRFEGDMRRLIEFVKRQQAGAVRDAPWQGKQPPPPSRPRRSPPRLQPPKPVPTD
jgi:hypothetical protein